MGVLIIEALALCAILICVTIVILKDKECERDKNNNTKK